MNNKSLLGVNGYTQWRMQNGKMKTLWYIFHQTMKNAKNGIEDNLKKHYQYTPANIIAHIFCNISFVRYLIYICIVQYVSRYTCNIAFIRHHLSIGKHAFEMICKLMWYISHESFPLLEDTCSIYLTPRKLLKCNKRKLLITFPSSNWENCYFLCFKTWNTYVSKQYIV